MDLKFVETLVSVLERSTELSEIEYSDGQRQVTLKRRSSRPSPTAQAPKQLATEPASANEVTVAQASAASGAPVGASHSVVAGMIGTFYRSPSPNQPAFVAVGDTVEEGQTLAIVEAMKLLNPIESDRAGRIAEILVADGTAVSADTPLFAIEDLEASHV